MRAMVQGSKLIKVQREQKIVSMLAEKKILSVGELSEIFNTSEMTIRRDLDDLASQGLIRRVHGGGCEVAENVLESTFLARLRQNRREKEKIAAKAVKYVEEGSIIFLDASTTTLEMTKKLVGKKVTAITNSQYTSLELTKIPTANGIMIGGLLDKEAFATVGPGALDEVKQYKADKCFFSTHAFSVNEGTVESNLLLIEIKRAMVKASKEAILLVDHTKFSRLSLSLAIPIDEIDKVIVDRKVSPDEIEVLKRRGIEIIMA